MGKKLISRAVRGKRPHRNQFLCHNLVKTTPSGARGRIWTI